MRQELLRLYEHEIIDPAMHGGDIGVGPLRQ